MSGEGAGDRDPFWPSVTTSLAPQVVVDREPEFLTAPRRSGIRPRVWGCGRPTQAPRWSGRGRRRARGAKIGRVRRTAPERPPCRPAVAGRYGGDFAVVDVARVMRMLGFQNQKDGRDGWTVTWVRSELRRGTRPEELRRELERRRPDKPAPEYYARRTVGPSVVWKPGVRRGRALRVGVMRWRSPDEGARSATGESRLSPSPPLNP